MTGIPLELQQYWTAISPLLSLRNEQEYDQAVERLNRLLDEVGTDEQHPLYTLLDTLGTLLHAYEEEQVLLFRRWYGDNHLMALFNFNKQTATLPLPIPAGQWTKLTDSNLGKTKMPNQIDSQGKVEITVPAECFALYQREET